MTIPPTKTIPGLTMREEDQACMDEAKVFTKCVAENFKDKGLFQICQADKQVFDLCVVEWRKKVGPNAKIRGEYPGLPPKQCQGLSPLVEKCLEATKFNFQLCGRTMILFKHCVKSLYGSEFVVD